MINEINYWYGKGGDFLKKAIIFFSLCIVAHLGFELLEGIFYLNVTSSLPMGFYMRMPSTQYKRGDYVVYEPSDDIKELIRRNAWGEGKYDFLKKVGAIAGDTYSVSSDNLIFEINGKYVGQVYETDNKGNELPKLRGTFKVEDGYFLPIATSARSFDGRYSGTIPESCIKAKVIPILTW